MPEVRLCALEVCHKRLPAAPRSRPYCSRTCRHLAYVKRLAAHIARWQVRRKAASI